MEIIRLKYTFKELCHKYWYAPPKDSNIKKCYFNENWEIIEAYIYKTEGNNALVFFDTTYYRLDTYYNNIEELITYKIGRINDDINEYKRRINSMVKLLSEKEIEIKKLLIKLDELWK